MTIIGQLRAGLYGRQSKDKTKSIDEQLDEGAADIDSCGWLLAVRYSDGQSASRYSTAKRPGWRELLADIDERRIDVLVLWESSRGDRKLTAWSAMLDLCRDRGVLIRVVTHGRTYDMSNSRDWKTMAEDGVASADESNKTSDRARRAMAAQARAGRPQGSIRYGFERIYDEHTKELIEQRVQPDQAPHIVELYRRVLAEKPVLGWVADMNERGIPSPTGRAWTIQTAAVILRNIDYTGRRRHKGEIYPATWPAIVPEADWLAVQRILDSRKHAGIRPARQRWLLSYLVDAVCGQPVRGQAAKRGRRALYICSGDGCLGILAHLPEPPEAREMDGLDGWVSERVIEYLATRMRLRPPSNDAVALAARTEAEQLQARLDEWRDSAARGETTPASLARIEPQIKADLAAARRREQDATTPRVLLDITDGAAGRPALIRDRWGALGVPARREIIRTLVTVRIEPARQRGTRANPFDPSRVHITWI